MVDYEKICICLTLTVLVVTATPGKFIKHDENYRLSRNHIPYHYSLNLTIDEASFHGETTIEFTTVNSTTTTIDLHVSPKTIYIEEIVLDYIHPCDDYYVDNITEIMTIYMKHKIGAIKHALTIKYIGIYPREQFLGLYKTVFDNNGVNEWYVSSQFEPTYARRVFPCFDEPGFKTTFDILITHPTGTFALANTPIDNIVYTPEGTIISTFKTTPLMPTYTIAMVVSHLAKSDLYPNTNRNFNYTVFSRPVMKKYTATASRYGSVLLDMLGDWTGIKYEDMGNTEIAQVAAMNFDFGAMENWGLVIYREQYILDEGPSTTNLQKQKIIMTMAHELAHQWFGNLVTLDWWADAWLNEGFATYCQYYVPGNSKFINLLLEDQYSTDIVQAALNLDAYPTNSALSSNGVESDKQDLAKFDAISYKKGGSIIRMLRSILGNEKFQEGVKQYLSVNKFGNANPKILLTQLNKVFKDSDKHDLVQLMNNWIYEPGYPVLTVTLADDEKSVIVSQEQFLYYTLEDTKATKWYVPISYTTSEEKDFSDNIRTWLEPEKNLTIDLSNSTWITLNNQRTSFYRVLYSDKLLDRLISVLKSNKKDEIHVLNRAQIVDDVLTFGRTGHIKYDRVFSLLEYLKHETEYQPWVSAFKGIGYLLERYATDDYITKMLKSLILEWTTEAFSGHTNETTNLEVLRNSLVTEWKCKTNDKECLDNAKKEYEKYKIENHITNHNIRETILCYGFKNTKTPIEDYNLLLKNYKNTDSVSEASSILFAIGCSEDEKVLNKYLSELINKNTPIARQDSIDVYRYIVENKKGIDLALKYVYSNIENILLRNDGVIDISDVITILADRITTEDQLKNLTTIIFDYRVTPGMSEVAPIATANANATIQWVGANKDGVTSVLESYETKSNSTSVRASFSIILSVFAFMFFQKSWFL